MNFIIVGASAGLGRALAGELAKQGHSLILVSGDERDLQAEAADLRIRYGGNITSVACHLKSDETTVRQIATAAGESTEIDGVFFPLGLSNDNDDGTQSPSVTSALVEANLAGTMALTSHLLPGMIKRNRGYIVGFGSVAAERGRSSNVVYAAAKRGLTSFFESIRHRVAGSNIKVHFFQMGYMSTAQTFGKKLPFPAADPHKAARDIVAVLERDRGLSYYPAFWRWICLALRLTPWFVYRKLRF